MTQGPGVETVSGRGERMFRRRVPSAGAAASRGRVSQWEICGRGRVNCVGLSTCWVIAVTLGGKI